MSPIILIITLLISLEVSTTSAHLDESLKADYERNILPGYPGLQVYRELDAILAREIKDVSLEANFDHLDNLLRELEQRPVRLESLIDAVKLVRALKYVVDEQRCDFLAWRVVGFNFEALVHASIPAGGQNEPPQQLSRLELLIRPYFDKIVATCEPLVEDNLERAIKLADPGMYGNLTAYLSDDFISKWSKKGSAVAEIGIQWRKMNPSLSWLKGPCNQHELILQQLFGLVQEHPQPIDGKELFYVTKSGQKWAKIVDQKILDGLIKQKVVVPCASYLKEVGNDVFPLMYLAVSYNGPDWADKFLERRSDRFVADLFRYEFCHLQPVRLAYQLWKYYSYSTMERDVVQRVT